MKKILFFCGCIMLSTCLVAQPMIAGISSHVKLSDVITAYKKMHPDYGKKQTGAIRALLPGLPREENDADYQFDRWLWYWRQHTDGNGYLVSVAKTWEEL